MVQHAGLRQPACRMIAQWSMTVPFRHCGLTLHAGANEGSANHCKASIQQLFRLMVTCPDGVLSRY
jgi:hypothetical protein